jgi:hypothetical protein
MDQDNLLPLLECSALCVFFFLLYWFVVRVYHDDNDCRVRQVSIGMLATD